MESMAKRLLEFLHDKGFSTLREVVVERRPDWSGDESLFVWPLLDDSVRDDEMSYEFIESLRNAARRQMNLWEPEPFTYVQVPRRVREWQEMTAF